MRLTDEVYHCAQLKDQAFSSFKSGAVIHKFPLEGKSFAHSLNCDIHYDKKPMVHKEESEEDLCNREEESLEELNR